MPRVRAAIAKATPALVATAATVRARAPVATDAFSIATRARNAVRSIPPVRMIARLAARATGDATVIAIHSATGPATNATARTTVPALAAANRTTSVSIAAEAIASAAARPWVAHAARSAAAARAAT